MSAKSIILDVLSQRLRYNESLRLFFCTFDQVLKRYPRLESCDFSSFLQPHTLESNSHKRYLVIYDAFMYLFCGKIRDGKMYDEVHSCYMSDITNARWSAVILETFYYFKLVFPAALFFYENPKYDRYTSEAKKLILIKYQLLLASSNSDTKISEQYDLCEGWRMKCGFIRRQITKQCLYTFNVLNNDKLIGRRASKQTDIVCAVNYRDVEHMATTIYQTFSEIVKRRKFVICGERTAVSKYDSVYKLKFVAPYGDKIVLGTHKIEHGVPLYFLFNNVDDLVSLIQIHNTYVRTGKCCGCKEIPIPHKESITVKPIQSIETYMEHLSLVKGVSKPSNESDTTRSFRSLRDEMEKTGFISVYDLNEMNTMACVKNRVVHFKTTVKRPLPYKPFYEKKAKKLVKIEKMIQALTMTRYKTDSNVSFNVNYQGPLGTIQLAMCRFLNENIERDCKVVKPLWVSNVCTTLDTIHSGILNTHIYRQKCLKRQSQTSYPMMNFPAMVTLLNDESRKNSKTNSVINNRISLNTCRMYGDELKRSLAQNVRMIQECSETDEDLTRIFYQIEQRVKELLPRNAILLIHLLYLHKENRGYTNEDIVRFFSDKMLCSRMLTTSNRAFTTYNLYCKSFASDAIDNVSVKSVKRYSTKPPTIERDELYTEYKKHFRDVGTLNRKVFRHRGRNANLIDLILNSKDEFFGSVRCTKLLNKLRKKYSCHPYARSSMELINGFREYKYGSVADMKSVNE